MIALGLCAPMAHAQTYRLLDLGVAPGHTTSTPAGINPSGQVAGRVGPSLQAARFTYGVVQELGTLPGGSTSEGFGINALGQVVGVRST